MTCGFLFGESCGLLLPCLIPCLVFSGMWKEIGRSRISAKWVRFFYLLDGNAWIAFANVIACEFALAAFLSHLHRSIVIIW